jgi:uncharacterized protein YjbJ (UPF0337 family)
MGESGRFLEDVVTGRSTRWEQRRGTGAGAEQTDLLGYRRLACHRLRQSRKARGKAGGLRARHVRRDHKLRLEWNRAKATRLNDHLNRGAAIMDWNRVEGNWKQVKGKVKEQWGKLTDDDLDIINGKQDQLEGRLQQRYGYAKDQAAKEVNDWYDRQKW